MSKYSKENYVLKNYLFQLFKHTYFQDDGRIFIFYRSTITKTHTFTKMLNQTISLIFSFELIL